MSNTIDRHQASRECDRRLRQWLHRQRMAPARTAPVRAYVPPAVPGIVNRASHFIINRDTGVVRRRYPKLRGNQQVRAAKRARIAARRLAIARSMVIR